MKHFLTIDELTPTEIQDILDLSTKLHTSQDKSLAGKNILFVFEKPSLRTAIGTEAAINHLGGQVIHTKPEYVLYGDLIHSKKEADLEGREAMVDTVHNVAQWCDGIFARVFSHSSLTQLASFDQIPIVNALSDLDHPMQALADLMTIQGIIGKTAKTKITFVGDANNVAKSLIQCGLLLGHTMAFSGPENYFWDATTLKYFQSLAAKYGGEFIVDPDPKKVLPGSQFVYADTFVSMGEEDTYQEKISHFSPYQVNQTLMKQTDNAYFLHCLPAYRGIEVTDEIIDGPQSLVYQQAKCRMITSKGLFTWLLS